MSLVYRMNCQGWIRDHTLILKKKKIQITSALTFSQKTRMRKYKKASRVIFKHSYIFNRSTITSTLNRIKSGYAN